MKEAQRAQKQRTPQLDAVRKWCVLTLFLRSEKNAWIPTKPALRWRPQQTTSPPPDCPPAPAPCLPGSNRLSSRTRG